MKSIKYFFAKTKDFLINPFWINIGIAPLLFITLVLNALIWYLWINTYRDLIGVVPIAYSSAVLILNTFLGNFAYRKEILVTYILLGVGLLVQIIYLVFLKFFALSQAF